jgi:type II secretory pathway pseudopilin PulG
MPIADCRLPNGKRIGLRPSKARSRAPMAFPLPYVNKHSAFGNRHSAFTLIELLVAVGLTAILLTMIAVIFYGVSQAFGAARASIEIHESARAALNALLNDLTAASFTPYDSGVQGYFALSQGPTDPSTGCAPPIWNATETYTFNNRVLFSSKATSTNQYVGNEYICTGENVGQSPPTNPSCWQLLGSWPVTPSTGNPVAVDALTFTTLAPQPGARYAAPEAVEQLALVRYALEWDGGNATLPGSSTPRPTYNLVKRVRFPCTNDPNLNMDQFGWAVMGPNGQPAQPQYQYLLPLEYTVHTSPPNDPDVILDETGLRYAQSEVIAFHVLSLNIRLFCLPQKQVTESSEAFLDAGFGTLAANPASLTDTTKNWPAGSFIGGGFVLRIIAGTGAGEALPISSANGSIVKCTGTWPLPVDTTLQQYRIEEIYIVTGTATSAGNNTGSSPATCFLNDATKNWPPNSFTNSSNFITSPPPANSTTGYMLRIIAGTGTGQAFPLSSASAGTVTCFGTWNPVPDNTSQYRIEGLPSGTASSGANTPPTATLTDQTQNWPANSFSGGGFTLQIMAGTGAGQALPITSASGPTVTCSGTWNPIPDATSQYQIVESLSWSLAWYQRGSYDFFGPTYRPPAVVEVTLEMTDARATHSFFFTQRFYVPASER